MRASSSAIVTVALAGTPTSDPPVGFASATVSVSFGSIAASFVTGTEMIRGVASPLGHERVPLVAVKSLSPAVPGAVA